MCGIHLQLGQDNCSPAEFIAELKRRGPDFYCTNSFAISSDFCYTIQVAVLCEQECRCCFNTPQSNTTKCFQQPHHKDNLVLLWNGEMFESSDDVMQKQLDCGDNDGKILFDRLLDVRSEVQALCCDRVFSLLASIHGPFALILFDISTGEVIFARDRFGRRSLVYSVDKQSSTLTAISSLVFQNQKPSYDVPANGLFTGKLTSSGVAINSWIPWSSNHVVLPEHKGFLLKYCENPATVLTQQGIRSFSAESDPEKALFDALNKAVRLRVEKASTICQNCSSTCHDHAHYAVLFSGGLDSTVLAAFLDRHVPPGEPIDLLNVSFDHVSSNTLLPASQSPDRLTALDSLKQLQAAYPKRNWNLVLIDVSKEEVLQVRDSQRFRQLLLPNATTVLDESLGLAVWFAARGEERLGGYRCPAKVVFTGIGADEQLGGYSRHRRAKDPEAEMRLDLQRISERNMSRDDRMIADHGREGRFPFLDENVVALLSQLPLSAKADFDRPDGDKLLLRRLAENRLGLGDVAWLPKRAMQFGSRIAKVDGLNPLKRSGHEQLDLFP